MKQKYISLFKFAPSLEIWKLWIEIDLSVDLTIKAYDNKETSYDLNTASSFEISWNK